MKRLLEVIGMSAGGWLGWMAGAWIGIFSAFIISVVGTGLGLYFTRKFVRGWLP